MTDLCQEPRCTRPAKKEWHGRKVCEDCYERFQDEEDKMFQSMTE